MEINKILKEYDKNIFNKRNRKKFQTNTEWSKEITTQAGIYAFFYNDVLMYVGETGSLKGRMSDVRRTVNHTLRRAIGNNIFSNVKGFYKATSKKKFPDHIEAMVDEYMEKLYVNIMPVLFGRTEIEEYIIEKYKPVFNSKRKRKSI